MMRIGVLTLAGLALSLSLYAQTSVTKSTEPVTAVVTIQAIDQTNRLVTIRDAKGNEDTVYAGPDIKRFSELKVGDKVQFKYYETVVYQLGKPGEALKGVTDKSAVTRTPATGSPGATLARQRTATVEVVSVDQKTPSVTVRTADGRTVIRKVDNKANIASLKPGDRIDITYTEALLMEVLPAK
jgi:hypothetical protein